MTLANRFPLLSRVIAVLLLAGLLLIPLTLISGKISERQATHAGVLNELATTGVGTQQMAGPVLFQPCIEHYPEEVTDAAGVRRRELRSRDCSRAVIADELAIDAVLAVDDRHRGIYTARFYNASLDIRGLFDAGTIPPPPREGVTREYGQAILQLYVADVRGIAGRAALEWNGEVLAFQPGSGAVGAGAGIHADVGSAGTRIHGKRPFSFHVDLAGMEQIAFVPSAADTLVTLKAAWPHPSFFGRHLPQKRVVHTGDFEATWHVSSLSSDAPSALLACAATKCAPFADRAFGVALIDPVNVYLQSNRAVSYGFLFIGLTFALFFITEILRRIAIHPAQYTLVGLALTIFFLLLFSLAEHVAFALAYAIAASACVALLGFYTAYVLKKRSRGCAFGAMMSILYVALYMLLRSEDYALLMGSCLVFGALAALMILTRRLDWSSVARTTPPNPSEPLVNESR